LSHQVPGYYATVHRSLTEPVLTAGVPRNVAIVLGMSGALFCVAWHIWAFAPLVVLAYLVAVFICRRDPYIFDIVLQNRGQKNVYFP
jgi:type IV secretion system protein TrbD